MSGPFQVGDVVVCVDNRPPWIVAEPAISAFKRLRKGQFYRVERVGQTNLGKVGIDVGVPNSDLFPGYNDIWPPHVFRKVPPAERAFTAQMRALRPIKVEEPA